MYSIGICDDDPVQVQLLSEYLQVICEEKELELNIFSASNGEEFIQILEENEMDIIFLDIEMDGLDGLEVGKIIRSKMEDVVIVFITGFKNYALESYSIKALDYIMKPLTRERFNEAFFDAKKRVDDIKFIRENEKNFIVKQKEGMISLRYSDIYYFEKDGKNMHMICRDDTYTYRTTIKDLKKSIESDDFIQCHQGYIINITKISNRKENALVLGDINTIIPIGKTYRKEVIDTIERRLLMRW